MTITSVCLSDLCQLFANIADGAFIVNRDQRILYWNQAAQKLLGYAPDEVVGQTCYEILGGQDDKGSETCRRHCHVVTAANTRTPATNFDICVRVKSGQLCWINVSTLIYSNPDNDATPLIVHLFRDNTHNRRNEQFIRQVLTAVERIQASLPIDHHYPAVSKTHADGLTSREREVLGLLAQGLSTREIAHYLSISNTTARNHIQSILRKLGVHSRLEAVVRALEYGFITRR